MLNLQKAKMIVENKLTDMTDSLEFKSNNMAVYQIAICLIVDPDFYLRAFEEEVLTKYFNQLNLLALNNPDEFISFLAQEETLQDVNRILTYLKPETAELIRSLLDLRANSNIPSLVQSQMEKVSVLSKFPPGVLPIETSYVGPNDVMTSPATLFHPRNLILQQMHQNPTLAAFPPGVLPLIAEHVGEDMNTSSFENSIRKKI